jgi:hypothetical protein
VALPNAQGSRPSKHKKPDHAVSADRNSDNAPIHPASLFEESAVAEVDEPARERIGKLIAKGAAKPPRGGETRPAVQESFW